MQKLIKDGVVVEDDYVTVTAEAGELTLPAGAVIVDLPTWQAHKAALLAHAGRRGVSLKPDEDALQLADDVGHVDLVVVNFPAFADGRGYSQAYLLRKRLGFRGELRAVGDVFKDTLYYQQRCGFNSFVIRADKDIQAALPGLHDFSTSYQASIDQERPLYLRR